MGEFLGEGFLWGLRLGCNRIRTGVQWDWVLG